jgi:hypothetical protein
MIRHRGRLLRWSFIGQASIDVIVGVSIDFIEVSIDVIVGVSIDFIEVSIDVIIVPNGHVAIDHLR